LIESPSASASASSDTAVEREGASGDARTPTPSWELRWVWACLWEREAAGAARRRRSRRRQEVAARRSRAIWEEEEEGGLPCLALKVLARMARKRFPQLEI
jgi:hypothetical protein